MKWIMKVRKPLKKYACLLTIFLLLGLAVVSFWHEKSYSQNINIEKILETDSYSYLPESAKEYIKDAYEITGEVVLTEKNKEENVPYLNPLYIEYMEMSKEEQEKVNVVPEVYVLDYVPVATASNLPSSYDLRNVNGKNFITPLKNQLASGMCWGFSAFEQAESYLMLKSNTAYNANSSVFSVRQLDYATSYEGIKDYNNKDGSRTLYSEGGNFFLATHIMANGLTLTSSSLISFNDDKSQKNYADVFNYKNSLYEVNSTIAFPNLKANPTDSELTSYVNSVKELVMANGGAYVGTDDPRGRCASDNSGMRIIRVDNSCSIDAGHAMQIIGWDDNYSYSYCKTGTNHNANTSGCSASNLVSKKGAWILRNSWGENAGYSYVYLAYDSQNSDINLSTNLTSMASRTWDNNYHENAYENKVVLVSTSDKVNYQKKINTSEKLEKIKFSTSGTNGTFNVSVTVGSKTYKNVKTVTTTYPGLYTVDLSSSNIIIDSDNFTVEVTSSNGVQLMVKSISAFTSNVDRNAVIQTNDLKFNTNFSGYETVLFSNTKNVSAGSTISYTLYRGNSNVSGYLTTENNQVGANGINAKIKINGALANGTYTLRTTYNNKVFTSNIEIAKYVNLTGAGTASSPYLIHNEEELKEMNYALNAYFKLANDINLTSSWDPIGTEEFPFTGSFDGDNHTINGLTISGNSNDYNGLFGYVKLDSGKTVTIKNLIIKAPNINIKNDAGALIGKVMGSGQNAGSPSYNMSINNVYIMDGSIISEYGNAGSLIGFVEVPYALNGVNTINVDSAFASSTIFGDTSSGLIGYISGGRSSTYALNLNLSNIQTMGRLGTDDTAKMATHGAIVGRALNYAKVTIDNFLATNIFYGMYPASGKYNILVASYPTTVTLNVKNGYGLFTSSSADANLKKTIDELKTSTLYSSWSDFSAKWKFEKINGYQRIPILKGVPFVYSNVSDITLKVDDVATVSDYLNVKTDAAKYIVTRSSSNTIMNAKYKYSRVSRVIYDYELTALEEGETTFNVINQYDGLEKNIKVTVLEPEKKSKLILNANDGKETTATQNYNPNESFNLKHNPFTNPGYVFKSWNTKANGTGTSYKEGSSITIKEDTYTLYAIWTPITYYVAFSANGGTGTLQSLTYSYNQSFNLPNNAFTRTGYTFGGWNTKADGTGTSYTNNQSVKNLTTVAGETVTLYVKWTPNTYTVVFNANGGSGTMNSMKLVYDTATNLNRNTFVKEGMVLKEWNTKADGTGVGYVDGASVKNLITSGTITLYAIWQEGPSYTINKYKVDKSLMIIDGIDAKTSLVNFQKNFTLGKNTTVQADVSASGYIYTGSKTKIYVGNTLVDEYINIIRGDANGDGNITSLDYVRVKNHIMNTNRITDANLAKGADANSDGNITSLDYVRIKNTIMRGS